MIKIQHHLFQFPLAHLAVGDCDPRARREFGQLRRHPLDGVHLVVQKVDLAAALEFTLAGFANRRRVPLADEGLDRQAARRWGGDDRQFAQAGHRHVQGARDRRGGQGQHVHLGAQGFHPLLVLDPEAVLLVDDGQAQILETHVVLQQLVGADQNIDLALGQGLQGFRLLLGRAEAGQQFDPHRPVGEAVEKVLIVLLGQQRGRRQHRHLSPVLHRHEGGAHRHLGLAETDIAAHHPIHRPAGAQVGDYRVDGHLLVGGFLERKGGGEGGVIGFAETEGVSGPGLAPSVEIQQFRRRVADLLGGLATDFFPLAAAEFVQRRAFRRRAGVAAQQMQRGDRHVQTVAVGVFHHHEFAVDTGDFQPLQPAITADAMRLVDHRRAGIEIGEVADDGVGIAVGGPPPRLPRPLAVQLRLGDDRQRRIGQQQALFQRRDRQRQPQVVSRQKVGPTLTNRRFDPVAAQGFQQHLAPPGRFGGEQHPPRKVRQKFLQRGGRPLGAGLERQQRRRRAGKVDPAIARLPQLHAQVTGQRLLDLGRLDKQQRRRQQRPLGVVTALLVAIQQLLLKGRHRRRHAFQANRQRRLRQIVEQGGGLLEKQRQIVFDAAGRVAGADFAIARTALRVALELPPPRLPEAGDGFLIQRKFPRRQQLNLRGLGDRQLGIRIEVADAFHLVVEQFDPVGALRAHRKQIENRAAHREFAVFDHLRHANVTRRFQAAAKIVQIQALPHLQQQRVAVQIAARRQALHQGRHRNHQHPAPPLRQAIQCGQALRHDVLMRREHVVGQRFPIRERQNVQIGPSEHPQFHFQTQRGLTVRRDRQH